MVYLVTILVVITAPNPDPTLNFEPQSHQVVADPPDFEASLVLALWYQVQIQNNTQEHGVIQVMH